MPSSPAWQRIGNVPLEWRGRRRFRCCENSLSGVWRRNRPVFPTDPAEDECRKPFRCRMSMIATRSAVLPLLLGMLLLGFSTRAQDLDLVGDVSWDQFGR